jgi:phosphoribosyl-ATP pyrophosphohydrolase/phosphoribosyl-AMP cyclohydrolase
MHIDFSKYPDGLAPAVIQDSLTGKVLMVGFMDRVAFEQTEESRRVTFFSRSRRELWIKGETSGNFLEVDSIFVDCDADTLLIKAKPLGPVCHNGTDTCFGETNKHTDLLYQLEEIIIERKTAPPEESYTSSLLAAGVNRVAQKVGEEAIELVIAAKDDDLEAFKSEAADLIYHLLVLVACKGTSLDAICMVLRRRMSIKQHEISGRS